MTWIGPNGVLFTLTLGALLYAAVRVLWRQWREDVFRPEKRAERARIRRRVMPWPTCRDCQRAITPEDALRFGGRCFVHYCARLAEAHATSKRRAS